MYHVFAPISGSSPRPLFRASHRESSKRREKKKVRRMIAKFQTIRWKTTLPESAAAREKPEMIAKFQTIRWKTTLPLPVADS